MSASRRPGLKAKTISTRMFCIVLFVVFASLFPVSQASAAPIRWASLDQSLSRLAPQSNLLVAEFAGSGCQTIHGRDEESRLAIASTFKLYVLGELARQVQLGIVSWTNEIVLEDGLRSMPSGDYAFAASGTRVEVRSLAEAMIWKSDNTATDHLIDLLGRENVYQSFAAYGHGDPSINAPLLLTRELFAIKMTQSSDWMQRYMQASDADQLAMLESDIDPLRLNPEGDWGRWNGPTAINGIEWFASAAELCRVSASLWSIGAQPGLAPVREIMTGNRGGIGDQAIWERAGYKGGFEAGVVNMTFVLERSDGRVFFVSAGYNTSRGTIAGSAARNALESIFACLGVRSGISSCAGRSGD